MRRLPASVWPKSYAKAAIHSEVSISIEEATHVRREVANMKPLT